MEYDSYLSHHGIKGQKWGIRRYQNSDGSLTEEGRRHYGIGPSGIAPNTARRMAQGMKIGVAAGLTSVGLKALAGASYAMAASNPVGVAIAVGGAFLTKGVIAGAITGTTYGAIAGAIETKKGRDYMRKNNYDIPMLTQSEYEKEVQG